MLFFIQPSFLSKLMVRLQSFFACKHGVCQGDPLSLLFCLTKEVLSKGTSLLVQKRKLQYMFFFSSSQISSTRSILGFLEGSISFTYLGVPIFPVSQNISYCKALQIKLKVNLRLILNLSINRFVLKKCCM